MGGEADGGRKKGHNSSVIPLRTPAANALEADG